MNPSAEPGSAVFVVMWMTPGHDGLDGFNYRVFSELEPAKAFCDNRDADIQWVNHRELFNAPDDEDGDFALIGTVYEDHGTWRRELFQYVIAKTTVGAGEA